MSSSSGPELIFGFIGASGTNLPKLKEILEASLTKVRYNTKYISLSELLPLKELGLEEGSNEYERIKILQKAGNDFREKNNLGAVVSLGISEIRDFREKTKGDPNERLPRQAYIIKSLKRPEEITRLRKIYGKNFWAISAYTPRDIRVEQLAAKIKPTLSGEDESKDRQFAEEIIRIDMYQSDNKFGQDVRATFPLGDVFFEMNEENIEQKVERFIELIFNNSFKTPDDNEYGMFQAYASAFRSSALSRQVGAAILSEKGDIISTGLNEVPKFGGGHYKEGDKGDAREFKNDEDSNRAIRNEMLKDVFEQLKKEKWLKEEISKNESEKLVELAFDSEHLKKIKFLDVTEFGREVHAEMSALMEAARKTVSAKDGILYCTTFPCHVCAKHIVAAGIKKVIYISPYPKSLAKVLFKDSISVDESPYENTVEFLPFVGIAPKRYMDLFEMSNRKNEKTGKINVWKANEANPRFEETKPYQDDEINDLKVLSQTRGN